MWNSSLLLGTLVHNLSFAFTVSFTSIHSAEAWTLTTVYGPSQDQLRDDFVTWLHDIDIPDNSNWLFLGDFNFYRSTGNINKPGGNLNDIFIFNEVISHLGLLEIPIKGRALTWSNMQEYPLLEQIDWFFTSTNRITTYPNTLVKPLAKYISDHVPCVVSIQTNIPKAQIFRFEIF